MRVTPDLLVIGGGVTGLGAALAAARAGASVRVVDWGRDAGSGANAGSLHVQMQSRFLRLYPQAAAGLEADLPLYVAAAAEWVRLDAELGGVELSREGGLMVAETPEDLDFLARKADREAARGLSTEILGRDALLKLAPYLSEDLAGAELCRNEGKLNPLLANAKLRAAARAAGVGFAQDRIRSLEAQGRGILARGAAEHRARQAVVATSWGTGEIARGLGLGLPVTPEPLHMNITEPAAYGMRHLVQHASRMITLKQFLSGQIVIGGGWPAEPGGAGRPRVLAPSLLGNVALAARLAPGIAGLRVLRTWAGLNTVIDGRSVIGRAPGLARAVLAVPGDAGYTLGPLVGRIAACVALGTEPPADPAPFGPERFAA